MSDERNISAKFKLGYFDYMHFTINWKWKGKQIITARADVLTDWVNHFRSLFQPEGLIDDVVFEPNCSFDIDSNAFC